MYVWCLKKVAVVEVLNGHFRQFWRLSLLKLFGWEGKAALLGRKMDSGWTCSGEMSGRDVLDCSTFFLTLRCLHNAFCIHHMHQKGIWKSSFLHTEMGRKIYRYPWKLDDDKPLLEMGFGLPGWWEIPWVKTTWPKNPWVLVKPRGWISRFTWIIHMDVDLLYNLIHLPTPWHDFRVLHLECILFTDLLNKHTPFEHIAATLPQKRLHEFQNLPRSGGYLQSSGGVKVGCPEPLLTQKGHPER